MDGPVRGKVPRRIGVAVDGSVHGKVPPPGSLTALSTMNKRGSSAQYCRLCENLSDESAITEELGTFSTVLPSIP